MTLIAHGILALNKAIKDRNKGYWQKQNSKSAKKLKKLEKAEDFIAEEMNLLNKLWGGPVRDGKHPMAFESMLIANVAVVAASPIIGVVAGAKALKDKIESKRLEKEEEKKEKARIKKQEAEAESEKMEIDLALDLIEKADAVFTRYPDARDTSAKTVGLISNDDGYIQIVNLFAKDENRGDYVIFLYRHYSENGDTNVFFKNPQTGNYEHMAEISSQLGKEKIWEAIQKRRNAVFDKKLRNSNTVKPVKDIKR